MKKTILAAASGLFLLVACKKETDTTTVTKPVTADATQIKTNIQTMETAYANHMMAKNVDSLMTYYGSDVLSMEYGQGTVSGKDNLKKQIGEELKGLPAKAGIEMHTDDVLVSDDGTLVSEWGSYTMKDSTGTSMSRGKFATVFRKNGNKYECVREIVVPDKKQEMTPADKK